MGHDLLEGHVTIPLLLAESDDSVTPRLRALLPEGCALTRSQVAEVVDIVCSTAAPAQALARARDHARVAVGELEGLPDCPARRALEDLAGYVVSRNA